MAITEKGRKFLKNVAFFALLVVAFFGLRYAKNHGYGTKIMASFSGEKVKLADNSPAISLQGTAKEFNPLPTHTVAAIPGSTVRVNFWAWNSQMGCLYANGGPVTTEGSLMAKQGVKMEIVRQDDNNQLMAQLTSLAKGLHDGNNDPSDGVMFVGIMGDGAAPFLRALNEEIIGKFGADYRAEIVGSCGYSRGEDKLMGPEAWKTNPQSLRGSFIAAVLRDGDWNVAIRYALDNNIPINPDETTFDPMAMNFVNPKDYVDAGQKLISGYSESRKLVLNGKATGRDTTVTVQGAATWTPVDVTIAQQKGGVVTVISTKEYANQMPHVLIGIHKWNQTHRETVEKILTAFAEGGDQVLTYPKALDRAAEISQEINKESGADANFWKKYYLGVREKDKTGMLVDLGGSKANNLADMLVTFGLAAGTSPSTSRFHATYTVFGGLSAKMYPKLVKSPPPVDSILDLSYLKAVQAKAGQTGGQAEVVKYAAGDSIADVVAKRGVAIEFATGSDKLTPAGEAQLAKLFDELSINALRVVIHGHTDNTGTPAANQSLSEERALAVKTYLEQRGPSTFPEGRVSVQAHGSSQPIASNKTDAGRKANRRVEIVIGQ